MTTLFVLSLIAISLAAIVNTIGAVLLIRDRPWRRSGEGSSAFVTFDPLLRRAAATWEAATGMLPDSRTSRAWAALTPDVRRQAIEGIPAYVASMTEHRRPRFHSFSTYLGERLWSGLNQVSHAKPCSRSLPEAAARQAPMSAAGSPQHERGETL